MRRWRWKIPVKNLKQLERQIEVFEMTLNFPNTMSFMEDVIQLVNFKAATAILTRVQAIAPDSSDDEDEDLAQVAQAARRNERLIEAIKLLKDEVHELKRQAIAQKTGYLITHFIRLLLFLGGICACLIILYTICYRS